MHYAVRSSELGIIGLRCNDEDQRQRLASLFASQSMEQAVWFGIESESHRMCHCRILVVICHRHTCLYRLPSHDSGGGGGARGPNNFSPRGELTGQIRQRLYGKRV